MSAEMATVSIMLVFALGSSLAPGTMTCAKISHTLPGGEATELAFKLVEEVVGNFVTFNDRVATLRLNGTFASNFDMILGVALFLDINVVLYSNISSDRHSFIQR